MDDEELKAIEERAKKATEDNTIKEMIIKSPEAHHVFSILRLTLGDIPALLKEVRRLQEELELMSGITKRFIEAKDLRGAFLQFLADEINEGLTSNMTVKVDDDNKIHIKMKGGDQEDLDPNCGGTDVAKDE